jgi:hypothetical protein
LAAAAFGWLSLQRGSLAASASIFTGALTDAATASGWALRTCCGTTVAVFAAPAGAILVVFTVIAGTACNGLAAASRSLVGNASHSATAATPSRATVPNAAMTRCEFERTPCQNVGRMS